MRLVTPDIGASTIGGQISWDPMRSAGTARFTTPDSTLESSTRQTTSLASDQGVEKGGYTDAQSREFRGFELLATTEYPCGARCDFALRRRSPVARHPLFSINFERSMVSASESDSGKSMRAPWPTF